MSVLQFKKKHTKKTQLWLCRKKRDKYKCFNVDCVDYKA